MSATSASLAPRLARPHLGRPDWATDGKDWPNRATSQFRTAGGLRWHIQLAGAGPALLLLHGTGAATHSWRDLAPLLAEHYTVIAPDLPGHGFTEEPARAGMTLPGMAEAIAALLTKLGIKPVVAVGHSAGAAILARMCAQGLIAPRAVVSLNGALRPFQHAGSQFFAPLAKLFARTPLVPFLFSLHAADTKVVERLIRGTGSTIDAAGLRFYTRLSRRSGHAGAALTMMANWDLAALQPALSKQLTPWLLVAGANDRSIPPADAQFLAGQMPDARVKALPGLGHLAHEERPAMLAQIIRDFAQEHGA